MLLAYVIEYSPQRCSVAVLGQTFCILNSHFLYIPLWIKSEDVLWLFRMVTLLFLEWWRTCSAWGYVRRVLSRCFNITERNYNMILHRWNLQNNGVTFIANTILCTCSNQRLRSAGDNDRKLKRFCSSAVLWASFTWQMVKTRVTR